MRAAIQFVCSLAQLSLWGLGIEFPKVLTGGIGIMFFGM